MSTLIDRKRLLTVIARAQARYIAGGDPREMFDDLLLDLLSLTGSEYGFIGEILHTPDARPFLKTYALTNISWDDDTRRFYEERAPRGLEFHNLKTLFGEVIVTGEPVIANSPATDPRRGGLPPGHPSLDAFLGLPFYSGHRFVGTVGLANRPGGYEPDLIDELRPFLATCANIIEADRSARERIAAESTLRRTAERIQAVHDSAVDAIITIDTSGVIETVNPAATSLFGYRADEMIDRNVSMLMPAEIAVRHDGFLRHYLETGEARIIGVGREAEGQRKDGARFPVELSVSEVLLDGERFFTGVIRDITERKEVERLKDEFVSSVSHELRTPLTSIRGSLGLLEGGVLGDLPDAMSGLVRVARSNTDRLIRLITDILDLEKIEAGGLELRLADIAPASVVEAATREMRGLAEQEGCGLTCESIASPLVRVDLDRMVQVLTNLISNAIKYAAAGGVIEVRTELAGADGVRFSVRDRGPGIPEEMVEKIFDRFQQVDGSNTRSKGGTGLGLAIVRAIVQEHGSAVVLDTRVGEGCIFSFVLPAIVECSSGGPAHTG